MNRKQIEQAEQIKRMIARAKGLTLFGHAPDGRTWGKFCAENLQGALDGANEETDKETAALYKRAHAGDREARVELNALRIELVNNYIIPTLNFGSFFEVVTLADNESPYIQNNTRQQIKAGYISQNGDPLMTKVIPSQTEYPVDLHEVVTDEVTYKTRDLNKGDITAAAKSTFDIQFDLRNQIEQILFNLLTDGTAGAYQAFDFTNAKPDRRTLNLNTRVRKSVLPTTNDISVGTPSGSTVFDFATLQAIVNYAARFANCFPDGELRPTGEVIVPADDITGIANTFTTVINSAGPKPTDIVEQLASNGFYQVGRYLGVDWSLIPDNTIARSVCYPKFNRPVGKVFFKPSFDDAEETVDRKHNTATIWAKKVTGAYIPIPQRVNAARFTYSTN